MSRSRHLMIAVAGYVAVIAAVLALIWMMQRRLIYFPASHVPAPGGLLLRDRFSAIDQIGRIHVPLLVIAGGRDRIVPIAYSRRLYEAAVAPKTLLVRRRRNDRGDRSFCSAAHVC